MLAQEEHWDKKSLQFGSMDQTVIEIHLEEKQVSEIFCRLDLRENLIPFFTLFLAWVQEKDYLFF